MEVFPLVNIKLYNLNYRKKVTIPNKENKVHNTGIETIKKFFCNFIFMCSEILIQYKTKINRLLSIPDPSDSRSVLGSLPGSRLTK